MTQAASSRLLHDNNKDTNVDALGFIFAGVCAGVGLLLLFIIWKHHGVYACPTIDCRREEVVELESAPEEERQTTIEKKKAERRAKCIAFLKPYTMVVKKGDLYMHVEESTPTAPESVDILDGNKRPSGENGTDNMYRSQEAQEYLMLTLPVNGPNGKPRTVEANCAICLAEYEVGDAVVRSASNECCHAFHNECILMWLSKGKKRCPMCRNFFVAGVDVDKQVMTDENLNVAELEASNSPSDTEDHLEESEEDIIRSLRELRSSFRDLETGRPNSLHGDLQSQRHVDQENDVV